MLEFFEYVEDIQVQPGEYARLLGYPPDFRLEGRARELAEWAAGWYAEHGRPWMYARQTGDCTLTNGVLLISGTNISSSRLREQFLTAGARDGIAVAVSAGRACEDQARALWEEGKPDEYFFLEIYGSAVVERLVTLASFRLCDWADRNGAAILPHDSPGYPGWDISGQEALLNLIRRDPKYLPRDEITALATGMLHPKKSLLAMFGVASNASGVQRLTDLVPCEQCSLPSCRYRRAPYAKPLPHVEGMFRPRQSGGQANRDASLPRKAPYSINPKALHKWMNERLRLGYLADGSIDARFRYSGTTCSNLGQPIEFDYAVTLGPAAEGYPIRSAACGPAPEDQGHRAMCEFIDNADALMRSIAAETPLIGLPLEEVFAWTREFSPSGCYCKKESRDYKWGLVFEVLHYTLAYKESQAHLHPQTSDV